MGINIELEIRNLDFNTHISPKNIHFVIIQGINDIVVFDMFYVYRFEIANKSLDLVIQKYSFNILQQLLRLWSLSLISDMPFHFYIFQY